MTILKPGDESFHYSDGSHNWTAPTEEQQEQWRIKLEAHMELHRHSRSIPYARDPRREY